MRIELFVVNSNQSQNFECFFFLKFNFRANNGSVYIQMAGGTNGQTH